MVGKIRVPQDISERDMAKIIVALLYLQPRSGESLEAFLKRFENYISSKNSTSESYDMSL